MKENSFVNKFIVHNFWGMKGEKDILPGFRKISTKNVNPAFLLETKINKNSKNDQLDLRFRNHKIRACDYDFLIIFSQKS